MSNRIPRKGFDFPSCPGKPKVPSDKEVEALTALKSIKERVRSTRNRLSSLRGGPETGDPELRTALEKELNRLKSDWDVWEERRQAAATERMILLGHEEGTLKP